MALFFFSLAFGLWALAPFSFGLWALVPSGLDFGPFPFGGLSGEVALWSCSSLWAVLWPLGTWISRPSFLLLVRGPLLRGSSLELVYFASSFWESPLATLWSVLLFRLWWRRGVHGILRYTVWLLFGAVLGTTLI